MMVEAVARADDLTDPLLQLLTSTEVYGKVQTHLPLYPSSDPMPKSTSVQLMAGRMCPVKQHRPCARVGIRSSPPSARRAATLSQQKAVAQLA